jgi:feruloyl esterase
MLTTGLRLAYATANTDMGTGDARGRYTAGTGHPEMIKDWGWRSTHAMTVAGKEITEAYYGQTIRKSLFNGCSTGGHQALMEAQRFPADYDGILAGAAGNNRIALHLAFLYYLRVAQDNPGFWISPAQGQAIRKAVISRCAGQGSGLPTDDFVANPGTCDFNPDTLLCKAGQDAATCLTAPQVAMLKKGYAGVQNLANGHTIYDGIPFGAETQLVQRLGAQGGGAGRGTADLLDWAKGPAYSPVTFDFNRDVEELYRTWGADINALPADLSAFKKHGGRLVTYHGWEDTTVSPFDSINYHDRLGGDASSFSRLFMVPGMGHCQGGPGIDNIGATFTDGQPNDADHNIIVALDRWVMGGPAPERVVATKWSGGRGGGRAAGAPGAAVAPQAAPAPRTVVATRPVCAYPKVARYNGTGDNTKAENYACVSAPKAKFTPPSPEYLVNTGAFTR